MAYKIYKKGVFCGTAISHSKEEFYRKIGETRYTVELVWTNEIVPPLIATV